jgi:hypothetical protein
MRLGKITLLALVPALVLSGCTTSITAEQAMARYGTNDPAEVAAIQQRNFNQAMAGAQASNAQLWGQVQQGNVLLQRGQQQMNTQAQQNYNYQRSDGVWVRCTRLSDSVVNCQEF